MIKRVNITDPELAGLLYRDTIVNYFILLGISMTKYKDIFDCALAYRNDEGRITAALFKRKTGNVQFYGEGNYDIDGFVSIIKSEGCIKLIGEMKVLRPLIERMAFAKIEEGAFIGTVSGSIRYVPSGVDLKIKRVEVSDVDRIVELYKTSFKSFAPYEILRDKLLDGSGRGYCIEDSGRIVSTAQTAFENSSSAVIAGVATHPEYRKRGYAVSCISKLCRELIDEGKSLALQYDNQGAGGIYRSLGFMETGRMISCYLYKR